MDEPSPINVRFPVLDTLQNGAPATLDLNSSADLDMLLRLAGELLASNPEPDDLREIEAFLGDSAASSPVPLSLSVAAKLALSKAIVTGMRQPGFVSVVFAVYKEHNRIRTPGEHPHGEDFLTRKIAQLHWLFDGSPQFGWELIIVDDGCPEGSGKIAEEMIARNGFGDRARVLFLENAIRDGLPVAAGLGSTADSQKGGAVLFGMWDALQNDRENHTVLFTDADLSTHLGQIGLLLDRLGSGDDTAAAIGSRRGRTSVVVKKGTRNTRGKLFIYLWKRLIATLPEVIDTQCAFKAFRADVAREVIAPAIEKKFAFDIELLVKVALLGRGGISTVPIAWIDSEAASTTTDLEPYLPMLQSIVRIYREYLPGSAEAEPFARFIESLDADSWDRICENVPGEIAGCEPFELGSEALVSADRLRESAGLDS